MRSGDSLMPLVQWPSPKLGALESPSDVALPHRYYGHVRVSPSHSTRPPRVARLHPMHLAPDVQGRPEAFEPCHLARPSSAALPNWRS